MKTGTIILIVVGLFLSGCSCDTVVRSQGGDPELACLDHWTWREKEIVQVPPPQPQPLPCAAPAMVSTIQGYPVVGLTGEVINIEKMVPNQIAVNVPFDYRVKVTNLTDRELLNVVVTDVQPDHMKLIESDPEIYTEAGQVQWRLGALGPNASKIISVRATALETQTIRTCANVTYEIPTCAKIAVVAPQLQLVKHAPAESSSCDRIALRYVVTNSGSGFACDIAIEDSLPEDMMDGKGRNKIFFTVDSLASGQSREFEVIVDAIRPGSYSSRAIATSQTGGSVESNMTTTIVSKPVLAINQSCPATQYINQPLIHNITITNKGDGIAENTVIVANIPDGVQFKSSTQGGLYTHSSPGKVRWNIGTLQPGITKKVSMVLSSGRVEMLTLNARASAVCAEDVLSVCETDLSGISAILLEVVDVSDPIELGKNETYVITVTNQGSAVDTNIRINCMLERSMEYVSSTGPTSATAIGGMVTFAPLPSLAPKAQVKWRVVVKAVEQGDVRFKTTMNSDQLTRIVEETEATRFFKY